MMKDYDQLLNKRHGKSDAIFAWHQDMGYWPSAKVSSHVSLLCVDAVNWLS
jgi:hypothetical protein